MSEMRLPDVDPGSLPPRPPPPATPAREDGSLALGVGLAWLINVGGGILVFILASMLLRASSGGMAIIAISWLPLLASIALAIWMITKGPRRTGIGIFIGIGSIFAVSLLLVAACFGIFFVLAGR